jgi:hypothetical protein
MRKKISYAGPWITQKEIDSNPQRWQAFNEGDMTEGSESIEELISDAKKIFALRFSGKWCFVIQYPKGNRETLSL